VTYASQRHTCVTETDDYAQSMKMNSSHCSCGLTHFSFTIRTGICSM
jgi:hypothetical protein